MDPRCFAKCGKYQGIQSDLIMVRWSGAWRGLLVDAFFDRGQVPAFLSIHLPVLQRREENRLLLTRWIRIWSRVDICAPVTMLLTKRCMFTTEP